MFRCSLTHPILFFAALCLGLGPWLQAENTRQSITPPQCLCCQPSPEIPLSCCGSGGGESGSGDTEAEAPAPTPCPMEKSNCLCHSVTAAPAVIALMATDSELGRVEGQDLLSLNDSNWAPARTSIPPTPPPKA